MSLRSEICVADIVGHAVLDVDMTQAPAGSLAGPPFGLLLPAPAGQHFDWPALLGECGALVAERFDLIAFLDSKRTNTQARAPLLTCTVKLQAVVCTIVAVSLTAATPGSVYLAVWTATCCSQPMDARRTFCA